MTKNTVQQGQEVGQNVSLFSYIHCQMSNPNVFSLYSKNKRYWRHVFYTFGGQYRCSPLTRVPHWQKKGGYVGTAVYVQSHCNLQTKVSQSRWEWTKSVRAQNIKDKPNSHGLTGLYLYYTCGIWHYILHNYWCLLVITLIRL